MGNTMVASIVIHTYVLGNGRKVIQRMALGLHVEESELLMATTETTVPFLVRGCNPSVNTEELVFQYGITAVLGLYGHGVTSRFIILYSIQVQDLSLLRLDFIRRITHDTNTLDVPRPFQIPISEPVHLMPDYPRDSSSWE